MNLGYVSSHRSTWLETSPFKIKATDLYLLVNDF